VSVAARVGLLITILTCICVLARPQILSVHPVHATAHSRVVQWTNDGENGSARGRRADDDGGGTVDLHGNEVSDAVAKYELDSAGSLYELHSPQTEVPRLKSPKS
jgi:hypothetical protein